MRTSTTPGPFNTLTNSVVYANEDFTYNIDNIWDPCFNTTLDPTAEILDM